jgi:lactate dehydrogenase-like 2-hydroxyacid dehydrogenase
LASAFRPAIPAGSQIEDVFVSKPEILMIGAYPQWDMDDIEANYTIHSLWEADDKAAFIARHASRIRAVGTRGDLTCGADIINALPLLEIIGCYGVGTDGIDFTATRPRGIKVTNTPDVLTDDVADLAIGLMISIAREMPQAERHLRAGKWPFAGMPLATRMSGKRLGIVGLGRIGMAIAKRAGAFGMAISYYNRSAKPESGYGRFEKLEDLAANSDFLVVAIAAGPATAQLINAGVLKALGPNGFFMNIARGAVVDEEALIVALQNKTIKGAALDVYLNEPAIDERFLALENAVLLPHIGSASIETRKAMGKLVRDNLAAHFAGMPLLTEVK